MSWNLRPTTNRMLLVAKLNTDLTDEVRCELARGMRLARATDRRIVAGDGHFPQWSIRNREYYLVTNNGESAHYYLCGHNAGQPAPFVSKLAAEEFVLLSRLDPAVYLVTDIRPDAVVC